MSAEEKQATPEEAFVFLALLTSKRGCEADVRSDDSRSLRVYDIMSASEREQQVHRERRMTIIDVVYDIMSASKREHRRSL